jgi:hypothetical protein
MSCPAQDRGLSKGIKYSYTLFGVGEAAGDALRTKILVETAPTFDGLDSLCKAALISSRNAVKGGNGSGLGGS